jgi:hypothetical protein
METNQKLLSMICYLFSDTRHLTSETYLFLTHETVCVIRKDKFKIGGLKD